MSAAMDLGSRRNTSTSSSRSSRDSRNSAMSTSFISTSRARSSRKRCSRASSLSWSKSMFSCTGITLLSVSDGSGRNADDKNSRPATGAGGCAQRHRRAAKGGRSQGAAKAPPGRGRAVHTVYLTTAVRGGATSAFHPASLPFPVYLPENPADSAIICPSAGKIKGG